MPESELAGKVTKVIKRLDKLVQDMIKDAQALIETAKELKGLGGDKEDADNE